MITSLILQGYNESVRYIQQQQAATAAGLVRAVDTRTKAAFVSLVNDSPVDTRAMQGGFRVVSHGPLTKEILNEVNRLGFSYPSAQATGTGSEGQPVIGFSGTFNSSWKGQVPNPQFRAAWIKAANSPMVKSVSLY